MSLWIPVESVTVDDRELVLRVSGINYTLDYTTSGQRVTIKSNMTDAGYAMYMYNLFKHDLGMCSKSKSKKR